MQPRLPAGCLRCAPTLPAQPAPPPLHCPLPTASRLWEFNGEGSIPYVPLLRAPYYVWVGHVPSSVAELLVENKVGC